MRFRKLKKKTKKKTTSSEASKNIRYANSIDKIKAFITDMFMIYAPILYIIAYLVLDGKEAFQASQTAPLLGVSVYGLIYAVLLSKFGQTPGKKAYTIKVVDDKTLENISFLRALLRFVMFLFSATILLGLFTGMYRKDKKSLHDIICHTVEIEVENKIV